MIQDNNKRIFKNTAYLYVRQLVIMALSFFTTRIVLEKLGASDYGVNNVVAGFVSMFMLVNSILQGATSRFLSLHLGKNDQQLMKTTFSTAFYMHLAIAVGMFILLESIGIWFLNSESNIPADRMFAANVVFQLSVLTVMIGITQTSYIAIMTSHEHFNMYAYMSIFDVVAKLLILYLLVVIPFDKLIVYAALQATVSLIVAMTYRIYCVRNFEEAHVSRLFDKALCKEMLIFSGTGIVGNTCVVMNTQGLNMLVNIFFSTLVNAALGIANRVNTIILAFVSIFMQAAQPQLVKYYGAGDMQNFHRLISFRVTSCLYSTKIRCAAYLCVCYCLFYIFPLPLYQCDYAVQVYRLPSSQIFDKRIPALFSPCSDSMHTAILRSYPDV